MFITQNIAHLCFLNFLSVSRSSASFFLFFIPRSIYKQHIRCKYRLKLLFLGELDHLPEVAFYMVGGIEEVMQKAERLTEEQN